MIRLSIHGSQQMVPARGRERVFFDRAAFVAAMILWGCCPPCGAQSTSPASHPVPALSVLNPVPALVSAEPATVTSLSTSVTILGTGFKPATVLKVNGVAVEAVYSSPTKLTATVTVPLGATGTIPVTATNPSPGGGTSTRLLIRLSLPTFTVSPATFSGGPVSMTLTGTNLWFTPVVTLDGKQIAFRVVSSSTLVASGYLPPWRTGTTTIGLSSGAGETPATTVKVPIAATAVSYDVASRFATQAAFGPRHDVIEHIQQIGLDAFITEQMNQPPLVYSPTDLCGTRWVFLTNATSGNSLLRARVSWAFQSFIVQQGLYILPTLIPWQHKMEVDAFGNFQQVLLDAASDASMGLFLNLAGNAAPSDPTIHPNQNFARELMQLFSLGDVMLNDDGSVKLDGTGNPLPSYDQATVLDMSRVFTGWNCDQTPDQFMIPYGCNYALPLVATESQHDHGQKTLFGTVVLPAGQDAATDRAMALKAVFNHPNVPAYVSRILIQRLVKSDPSPAYVARIAAVFKNDGTGVRGNLAAVIRAILLAPEARSGDTAPKASDGYLQEPLLFETFGMSLLGMTNTDGEPTYVPGLLGEDFDFSTTVFGYYSPTHTIPGTAINSPEFSLLNNLSLVQRSQFWWGMIQG